MINFDGRYLQFEIKPLDDLCRRVARMESALQQLAQCDLNDSNCASWEVANARLRALAAWGLSRDGVVPEVTSETPA